MQVRTVYVAELGRGLPLITYFRKRLLEQITALLDSHTFTSPWSTTDMHGGGRLARSIETFGIYHGSQEVINCCLRFLEFVACYKALVLFAQRVQTAVERFSVRHISRRLGFVVLDVFHFVKTVKEIDSKLLKMFQPTGPSAWLLEPWTCGG
jgi:hypothetical protein